MTRLLLTALLLLASSPLLAQRSIFPEDFTPSPCAPANSCVTYETSNIKGAGAVFQGFEMDPKWIDAHDAEMRKAFEPACRRHATCFAHPDNVDMFCNDILSVELRDICDAKYPKSKSAHDAEQCQQYAEVYALGVDQNARATWRQAQDCTAKLPAVTHTKPLDIWMVPESIPFGYKGDVAFNVLDPDTHVPVYAKITIEDQIVYAPSNPVGELASFYPFKFPFKFIRVPNAEGHKDIVPPMVTVNAPGYPVSKFRLNAQPRKVKLEMAPPVEKLHHGENKLTVTAVDDKGKPVEMRVMAGEEVAGPTNEPIMIRWPKGEKRPEIWATSLYNAYSDVVIAPAGK